MIRGVSVSTAKCIRQNFVMKWSHGMVPQLFSEVCTCVSQLLVYSLCNIFLAENYCYRGPDLIPGNSRSVPANGTSQFNISVNLWNIDMEIFGKTN